MQNIAAGFRNINSVARYFRTPVCSVLLQTLNQKLNKRLSVWHIKSVFIGINKSGSQNNWKVSLSYTGSQILSCVHFKPSKFHLVKLSKLPQHQPISILNMAENKYLTAYAKLGTSSCKKCKQKIEKGALRIAKLVSNPFSEDAGDMKQWFHPACIFETFVRARATTKKIEDPDDVEGFSDLQQEDKDTILKLIKGENLVR